MRVHGEGLADHMAAMVRAERAHAAAMAERADGVLAAGRAAAGLACRVQDAVLALIRSSDPADCMSGEMPGILAVDAAHLCVEADLPGARRAADGHRRAAAGRAPGGVPRCADRRRAAACRGGRPGAHDALVRVPGEGPPALLALLARDRHVLDPAQGGWARCAVSRPRVAAALRAVLAGTVDAASTPRWDDGGAP